MGNMDGKEDERKKKKMKTIKNPSLFLYDVIYLLTPGDMDHCGGMIFFKGFSLLLIILLLL